MTDWWQGQRWRLVQTNLREIDMRDISADRVVADLQALEANVLMINAAGIIASYPTKLPFHFQSPYLTGDSLHDILDACHAAGIRVIARTDFSKVRRPIFEQHPDWAYRTAEGEIVDYNGDVHVCINSPYQQFYALLIIEELLETHDFDGIFFNMGGYQTRDYSGNYYGICHCQHCRARFADLYGKPLPRAENLDDPIYRDYLEFKARTLTEHHQKVYRFIAGRWPDVCIANHTEFRRGFIRQESNTALDRPLPHWQYSASDNTKWAVGSYPQMVSSNTTVDFIDFPYRHVAVSPYQQALRLAQNLANGGALDYYLIGRLDNHEDRSGFEVVRDLFHYHAAHEDAYRGLESLADVLLLKADVNQGEYRGWFRCLTEAHIPFDVVRLGAASDAVLKRYSLVVAPGVDTLDDDLAARLDDFVAHGGTLLATGLTGSRDLFHNPRPRPVLRCLGIEEVLAVRQATRSSYLKFVDKIGFRRFGATDLVYVEGPYVYARYAKAAQRRMQLIPPHNFGPPERCYYDLVVDHPGFVVHPYGQGRAITVPWLPGTLFHRQGHLNTAWFCMDLLEGVAGVDSIAGNLPPQVEVTLMGQRARGIWLIHLVNGSGHFGNSFYSPLTLHDLTLRISQVPEPEEVTGLRAGCSFPYVWDKGILTVRIPTLNLFEAIRIMPRSGSFGQAREQGG